MTLLQEGQKIGNTYIVERYLGEGAFSEVYRVKHRFLGRQAMKVFKTLDLTIDQIEEHLEEAVLLSRIGHPNIIRVFEANVLQSENGLLGYFTMEYVPGGSLDNYWKSHGNHLIPLNTTMSIIQQVCQGVVIAHSEKPPIIHRDLKPQNILVGYDGNGLRIRVSDFGLAKKANPLTLLVSSRGTICFKAPETFAEPMSDSCAGDVWAIGCILYLLLTDRLPYFEDSNEIVLISPTTFNRPMIPASYYNISIDPFLDKLLAQSLAINPKLRYSTALDLLSAIEKWIRCDHDETNYEMPVSSSTKDSLGIHTSTESQTIGEMIKQAQQLAQRPGHLAEAADLMEQALTKTPTLASQFEYQLRLWRRGIAT